MEEAQDRSPPWWAPLAFAEGRWYRWNMAGAVIAVRRDGNVWRGRCRSLRWDTTAKNKDGKTHNEYTSVRAGTAAALRPCLPEKPFLVKTAALRIFSGMEIPVELDLPPLYRLVPVEDLTGAADAAGFPPDGEGGMTGGVPVCSACRVSGEALFTFSPFVLNETWYGDPMRGILCASLSVNVPADAPEREQAAAVDPAAASDSALADTQADEPGLVRLTALIRNRTKTPLELTAFPLYAGELAVYGKDRRLFCDKAAIDAYGNSDFRLTAGTGREEASVPGILLCPGSKSAGPTLVHQGTRIIKHITGL
ncbi:MAG: hypothetical protein LBD09_03135 [Treponema sp.]|jgi:hypothetical protein|nr:hypothetical protein [Treponema sp.]